MCSSDDDIDPHFGHLPDMRGAETRGMQNFTTLALACSGDDSDDIGGQRGPRPAEPGGKDTTSGPGSWGPFPGVRSRGTHGPWNFRGLLDRVSRRPSPA